jgi:predicted nuclease of predicted toxin-antitoxin system
MRLLVDECLSEDLARLARRRGHSQASHVAWIGKRGWKDWNLIDVILDGDWTFVTRNSTDFRGPSNAPGSSGQYADVELHAGLVCLNSPSRMVLELQLELFEVALDEIEQIGDLVNQVLEITLPHPSDEILRFRYKLPAD